MTENVLNKSAVKEVCKSQDLSMSGEFPESLNEKVKELILEAGRRASDNGRKTVFTKDL